MIGRALRAGSLVLLLAPAAAVAADVETISHGRAVTLEDHLVAGKFVLFDFYADWCGPCRALEPHVLELAGRYADRLAVRKIDIINWDTEVTRQHRIASIPHLVLYGPDGTRLAAGDAGAVLRRLQSGLGAPDGAAPSGRGGSAVGLLALAAVAALAIGLLARRRRAPSAAGRPSNDDPVVVPIDTASDPGDPAIWFARLQGGLEGPFTRAQLGDLVRDGTLEPTAPVRRRGDASWTTVGDVVG